MRTYPMSRPDPVPVSGGTSSAGSEPTLRRLLVGYDGSDASGVAASFGLWFAGKADARLTLLQAADDAVRAEVIASPDLLGAAAELRTTEDRRRRQELDNLRAYAAEGASVETVLVRGRAAKTLLEEARARDIDL